jgi:inosine-uridine nucleoside N-ribohydrolase
MRPVILDTDIGSDVDDILALVMLAKSPELDLVGITTVYGDTVLRAKIARATCQMLEQPDIDIVPGAPKPISERQVYWAGHEGEGISDLEAISIDTAKKAEDYLVEKAKTHAGEIEILAIGPLTNIAKAIELSTDFVKQVKQLYLMGGAYWLDRPEHNIRCDVDAAQTVFDSGISITAIGLDLTLRVWITEKDLKRIAALPHQLGKTLENQIRAWWVFRDLDRNHPHDPLAALSMIRPELFRFEYCNVTVERTGREFGKTIVSDCGKGRVRIASDVFVVTAEKEIVDRIAGRSPGQAPA